MDDVRKVKMRRWEKVIRIWGKSLLWSRWRSWMKGWWESITVKLHWGSFLSLLFLPIWEEKICGPGRENFLPGFPLPLFSSHSQTEENSVFHPIFFLTFSILPKFHPTKYNVKLKRSFISAFSFWQIIFSKKKKKFGKLKWIKL